jgi:hypothetical protein
MIVTAWYDGHSTYGLRILGGEVGLWFRPEWRWVTLHLPREASPASITLTEGFWGASPVLRSPRIRRFLEHHSLVPWDKNRPPHFELEPLGGGVFRLKWLERVPGKQRQQVGGCGG